MSTPGKIASRAIRQYRSRDIFPYLALRYFLESDISRRDRFNKENTIQVVRGSVGPTYINLPYFKERAEDGTIVYRQMHMPGAAESLAEGVLLDECAKTAPLPDRKICYSYWLTDETTKSGFYQPYMVGLKARQSAVKNAILCHDDCEVMYLDIKRFYPSIKRSLAINKWKSYCNTAQIDKDITRLGESIIEKQCAISGGNILTGPMFSHFVGNLVLNELDVRCLERRSKIFRYVDDYILVGSKDVIQEDVEWLRTELGSLGFLTHANESEKTLNISGEAWLKSALDFETGEISTSWMNLVGDIKTLLLFKIKDGDDIIAELIENNIRLPVRAYQAAVEEASSFERVREWNLWEWLAVKARRISIDSILEDGLNLRKALEDQLETLFASDPPSTPFERKRMVTKLRYRLGRALYLCEIDYMAKLLPMADNWPELEVHFAIIESLVTGRGDRVISMGCNVAQAAAQLFSAGDLEAKFKSATSSEASSAGLAIFVANGVPMEVKEAIEQPILQYATGPVTVEMFTSWRGFLREAACLHGVGPARHAQTMNKAFDVAEEVHFDAIALDYGYSF